VPERIETQRVVINEAHFQAPLGFDTVRAANNGGKPVRDGRLNRRCA